MPLAFPKPRRRVIDRIAYKRAAEAKAAVFRAAVWLRDHGACRFCGRLVRHTFELVPERGEVHHKRGRNVAPEDRYNVQRAVLLCLKCHTDPDVVNFYRRQMRGAP